MNLSIIIPVYNAEKYIEECLNSINAKLHNDIEVIIINDGSTDNSLKKCNKFKASNIKIYTNNNHGVSYSRNFGVEKAAGKWIMFVDADDLLTDNWYNLIKKYFDSQYDYIALSKNIDENKLFNKKEIISHITGYCKNSFFLAGINSKLYRSEFLKTNKILFKEDLINGEDMLFNIQSICLSNKYKIDNISIYKYRIHEESATHKFNTNYIKSDMRFHVYLDEILRLNQELDEIFIEEIENFSRQNAIIAIAYRLSLSGKYKIFRENRKVFKEYDNMVKYKKSKMNKITRIIYLLLKLRLYYIVFLLFNIKRKGKEKKEYFIDI